MLKLNYDNGLFLVLTCIFKIESVIVLFELLALIQSLPFIPTAASNEQYYYNIEGLFDQTSLPKEIGSYPIFSTEVPIT